MTTSSKRKRDSVKMDMLYAYRFVKTEVENSLTISDCDFLINRFNF